MTGLVDPTNRSIGDFSDDEDNQEISRELQHASPLLKSKVYEQPPTISVFPDVICFQVF